MIPKPGSVVSRTTDPTLYVVTMVSNPMRFESRYRLYREFAARMASVPGIRLVTVEVALGDRAFEVTQAREPDHVQLRSDEVIWLKESALNVGVSRLPQDWRYVAWIDADVSFVNPHWAQDTVHQLQQHHVVQLFKDAIDLGPRGEVLEHHKSFGSVYLSGVPLQQLSSAKYPQGTFGHPGFGWSYTREAWNAFGGMLDWAILGAGDHHMALGLVGGVEYSMPGGVSKPYRDGVMEFQARCEASVRRDVGYVDGTILHYFHGSKKNRFYESRWDILTRNRFDPVADLVRDWQGLWQLKPDRVKLRDQVRGYFAARNEDGVDP